MNLNSSRVPQVSSKEPSCAKRTKMMRQSQNHRVHILVEMKQGQCICPLSWSVHCNFTGEGKCNERGWACTPHPHQPGLILPSSLNVRQKAAVATLCYSVVITSRMHIVRKEKKIFLICMEIQKGSGAMSYMRKGFPIYEEMQKYLVIYEKALVMYDFSPDPF